MDPILGLIGSGIGGLFSGIGNIWGQIDKNNQMNWANGQVTRQLGSINNIADQLAGMGGQRNPYQDQVGSMGDFFRNNAQMNLGSDQYALRQAAGNLLNNPYAGQLNQIAQGFMGNGNYGGMNQAASDQIAQGLRDISGMAGGSSAGSLTAGQGVDLASKVRGNLAQAINQDQFNRQREATGIYQGLGSDQFNRQNASANIWDRLAGQDTQFGQLAGNLYNQAGGMWNQGQDLLLKQLLGAGQLYGAGIPYYGAIAQGR